MSIFHLLDILYCILVIYWRNGNKNNRIYIYRITNDPIVVFCMWVQKSEFVCVGLLLVFNKASFLSFFPLNKVAYLSAVSRTSSLLSGDVDLTVCALSPEARQTCVFRER